MLVWMTFQALNTMPRIEQWKADHSSQTKPYTANVHQQKPIRCVMIKTKLKLKDMQNVNIIRGLVRVP